MGRGRNIHEKLWHHTLAATWMDAKIIILSEVRQRKTNTM